jgi:hypothetical protein
MKGPLLLLGAAAVVGFAVAAQAKNKESEISVTPTLPSGKSIADMTAVQKTKLETWAKSKGVPVTQAYDLAKSLFQTKF